MEGSDKMPLHCFGGILSFYEKCWAVRYILSTPGSLFVGSNFLDTLLFYQCRVCVRQSKNLSFDTLLLRPNTTSVWIFSHSCCSGRDAAVQLVAQAEHPEASDATSGNEFIEVWRTLEVPRSHFWHQCCNRVLSNWSSRSEVQGSTVYSKLSLLLKSSDWSHSPSFL